MPSCMRPTAAIPALAFVALAACRSGSSSAARPPPEAPGEGVRATEPRTPTPIAAPFDDEASDDDDEHARDSRPPRPSPNGKHVQSFDEAKHALVRIYEEAGRTTTLYCACPYRGHVVDFAACGYKVQSDAARAARLEWEHVVPASAFGHTFVEWRDGHPSCMKKRRPFRGRKCAHLASPEFARIEGDMHNLFPEDGEINYLRGDRMMGLVPGEARAFGACDFELTPTLFEPRPEIRGDVARAYKYMEETYPGHAILPEGFRPMMDAWDAEDPPDAWEKTRNDKIAALQGNRNRFIDRAPGSPVLTIGVPAARAPR